MQIIEQNKKELFQICDEHHVKDLFLFGSVLTDKFNKNSDIDLLIQFSILDIKNYFSNYVGFKNRLENLFQREVDLVENQAIRNPIFRKIIDRDKIRIYGWKDS